jgi:hypothetical protein
MRQTEEVSLFLFKGGLLIKNHCTPRRPLTVLVFIFFLLLNPILPSPWHDHPASHPSAPHVLRPASSAALV